MADCDVAIALRPNKAWPVFERSKASYELNQFQVHHTTVPQDSKIKFPFRCSVMLPACAIPA